jgi:putative ABC transport system permease protein
VALGIAVIVAIDLAGDAATGSFRASMETLAGKTDLEILANGGIDEQWIGALDALPVNATFSPVLEGQAVMDGSGPVPLYGVDLVATAHGPSEPGGSQAVTATVAGRRQELKPARLVHSDSGDFLVVDIASAQQALGRFGKLDRIDVTLGRGEDLARVEQAIRATLPPAYLVERPGVRSDENQRMLRAFRWNLRVLGYISLVVGAFLIYNTISISVVRRRGEIGVLRALGAGRAAVLGLFLAEALLVGVVGAALGIALGRLLAGVTVRTISETVNALYTTSRPAPVELTWSEAWLVV